MAILQILMNTAASASFSLHECLHAETSASACASDRATCCGLVLTRSQALAFGDAAITSDFIPPKPQA